MEANTGLKKKKKVVSQAAPTPVSDVEMQDAPAQQKPKKVKKAVEASASAQQPEKPKKTNKAVAMANEEKKPQKEEKKEEEKEQKQEEKQEEQVSAAELTKKQRQKLREKQKKEEQAKLLEQQRQEKREIQKAKEELKSSIQKAEESQKPEEKAFPLTLFESKNRDEVLFFRLVSGTIESIADREMIINCGHGIKGAVNLSAVLDEPNGLHPFQSFSVGDAVAGRLLSSDRRPRNATTSALLYGAALATWQEASVKPANFNRYFSMSLRPSLVSGPDSKIVSPNAKQSEYISSSAPSASNPAPLSDASTAIGRPLRPGDDESVAPLLADKTIIASVVYVSNEFVAVSFSEVGSEARLLISALPESVAASPSSLSLQALRKMFPLGLTLKIRITDTSVRPFVAELVGEMHQYAAKSVFSSTTGSSQLLKLTQSPDGMSRSYDATVLRFEAQAYLITVPELGFQAANPASLHITEVDDQYKYDVFTRYSEGEKIKVKIQPAAAEKGSLVFTTRPSVLSSASQFGTDVSRYNLSGLMSGDVLRGFIVEHSASSSSSFIDMQSASEAGPSRDKSFHSALVAINSLKPVTVRFPPATSAEQAERFKKDFPIGTIVRITADLIDPHVNRATFHFSDLQYPASNHQSWFANKTGDQVRVVIKSISPEGLRVRMIESDVMGLLPASNMADLQRRDMLKAFIINQRCRVYIEEYVPEKHFAVFSFISPFERDIRLRKAARDMSAQSNNSGNGAALFSQAASLLSIPGLPSSSSSSAAPSNASAPLSRSAPPAPTVPDAPTPVVPQSISMDEDGQVEVPTVGFSWGDEDDEGGKKKDSKKKAPKLSRTQKQEEAASHRKRDLDEFFGSEEQQAANSSSNAAAADDEYEAGYLSQYPQEPQHAAVKRKRRDQEERDIQKKEAELLEESRNPESSDEYERLLMGSPNSSFIWIKYMAFLLSRSELVASRKLAQRAIDTISPREHQERFNVWMAWLNVEVNFGSTESVQGVLNRALLFNNQKETMMRFTSILERSNKFSECEEAFEQLVKKFKDSRNAWLQYAFYLARRGQAERLTGLLQRAIKALPKSKHLRTISKYAQIEFKHGSAERGRTIFEGIVSNYPKQTDQWSIYLDMEIGRGQIAEARKLFERITSLKLSTHNSKFFFKRWLQFEKEHGTPADVRTVVDRARQFVAS